MANKKPAKHASKAGSKRTKQFNQKHLKNTLAQRKQQKAFKEKVATRQMLKGKPKGDKRARDQAGDEDEAEPTAGPSTVDQLLNSTFQDGASGSDSEEDSEGDDLESLDSFQDEAETHKMDLKALKEQDPEFYKYLLDNDKALLEFDDDDNADDASMDGEEGGRDGPRVVTLALLQEWQKALASAHSFKALRKLLLAFRAVSAGEETLAPSQAARAYRVQDPQVFQNLVKAVLKFTPLVLLHHVPAKKLSSGKFKVPTQSKKYAAVQRCIKSYFSSLSRLFASIPTDTSEDAARGESLAQLAALESAKLIPYLVGNRKVAKGYAKLMLEQWATSGLDRVKIASFLAIRTLAAAGDASLQELVLKSTYTTLISSFKQTNVYTMPAVNLMKNSALDLFLLSNATAYQLAFTYIRQLALQLRAATKSQDKGAFQQVHNWQVVHAIDFWSLVLSGACEPERVATHGHSDLQALIFPLVQVGLGVVKLLPTSRFFPLHLHIIKSLLRITLRTGTFIPLTAPLLTMLNCSEFKRKPKPSTQLKGLDFDYVLRAPKAYIRTQTYASSLAEELAFALLEVFEAQSRSIAFPEIAIPTLITLKRAVKGSSSPKLVQAVKPVIEKLEANKAFIEKKRAKVEFTPAEQSQVDSFLKTDSEETPLSGMLRRERKLRAKKRELLSKNADEDEIMT